MKRTRMPATLSALVVVAMTVSPARAETRQCFVSISGRDGSSIRVETRPLLEHPLIAWRPPSQGTAIDLWISYWGSSLAKLAEPSGGYAQLRPTRPATPITQIEFQGAGGKSWRLPAVEGSYGHLTLINTPAAAFSGTSQDGGEILRATRSGNTMAVMVLGPGGHAVATTVFDLNAKGLRDALMSQAREAIEQRASDVCSPGQSRPLPMPPMR
jgi:hypothetical protein